MASSGLGDLVAAATLRIGGAAQRACSSVETESELASTIAEQLLLLVFLGVYRSILHNGCLWVLSKMALAMGMLKLSPSLDSKGDMLAAQGGIC